MSNSQPALPESEGAIRVVAPITTGLNSAHRSVIETLEEYLELARKGAFNGVAIVLQLSDTRSVRTCWIADDKVALLGALRLLESRLADYMNSEPDERPKGG